MGIWLVNLYAQQPGTSFIEIHIFVCDVRLPTEKGSLEHNATRSEVERSRCFEEKTIGFTCFPSKLGINFGNRDKMGRIRKMTTFKTRK